MVRYPPFRCDQSCTISSILTFSSSIATSSISTMGDIQTDICYGQFAYHIALLRQFVTYQDVDEITTTKNNNDSNINSELDNSNNSIGRKWKKVINLRSKYKNNAGTTDGATKNATSNETIRTVEADDVLDHSVNGPGVWNEKHDSVGKMGGSTMMGMGGGMKRSGGGGGMRRNFSTPVLTDLSAYPTLG